MPCFTPEKSWCRSHQERQSLRGGERRPRRKGHGAIFPGEVVPVPACCLPAGHPSPFGGALNTFSGLGLLSQSRLTRLKITP